MTSSFFLLPNQKYEQIMKSPENNKQNCFSVNYCSQFRSMDFYHVNHKEIGPYIVLLLRNKIHAVVTQFLKISYRTTE